ncbi:MAG: EAL domain-containing protein [Deinococcota bacterium]
MFQRLASWLNRNLIKVAAQTTTVVPPDNATFQEGITFHNGQPSSERHVNTKTWLLKRTLYLVIFSLGSIGGWLAFGLVTNTNSTGRYVIAAGLGLLTILTVLLWYRLLTTRIFERSVALVTGLLTLSGLLVALYNPSQLAQVSPEVTDQLQQVSDFVTWSHALFVFYFMLGNRYGLLYAAVLYSLGLSIAVPFLADTTADSASQYLLVKYFLTSPFEIVLLMALSYFIEQKVHVVGQSNVWMSTAFYDSLTGLPNRRFLQRRVSDLIAQKQPFGLLLLDIDNFKRFNDALGHHGGDTLLRRVARRLETAIPHHLFARVSSDEFAFVILDHNDKAILDRANWILDSFRRPFHVANAPYDLQGSVGVVLYETLADNSHGITGSLQNNLQDADLQPEAGIEQASMNEFSASSYTQHVTQAATTTQTNDELAEGLLRKADIAVQEAKMSGKSRYQIYAAQLGVKQARVLTIEQSLRDAFAQSLKDTRATAATKRNTRIEGLLLLFQPVMSLTDNKVRKLEVLLRWQHPVLGPLSPEEFVPIAEKSGLIVPLGTWVLHRACEQMAQWHSEGVCLQAQCKIAVNVSAAQFLQSDLAQQVAYILRYYNLPASCLELEITESMAMDNLEHSIKQLNILRSLGVTISLDDFGTGYASLASLHALPIHCLKIDKSFIRATDRANRGRQQAITMVRSMIALAKSLDLEVTAEGVETAAQLHVLQALECNYVQGYLLSRPRVAKDATMLLRDNDDLIIAPSGNAKSASTEQTTSNVIS